ncbi:MAG TPA: EAL domain-containing protein, partial [Sphingobium sp.]
TDRVSHLLVIRLNNFLAIEAAFGAVAADEAMDHLRCAAERHLGRIDLHSTGRGEMTLKTSALPMMSAPAATLVDRLCAMLGAEPFRFGEVEILLSVSAGCAKTRNPMQALPNRALEDQARDRLSASTLPAAHVMARSVEWAARYRRDMAAAVRLMAQARCGALMFNWRPIARTGLHGVALHQEAAPEIAAVKGDRIDYANARAATERLGLAHMMDRLLLSHVLDQLAINPSSRLSVPISTQSLSLNLQGADAGWTDLLARLKRDPGLAGRLTVEMADNEGMTRFQDALAFVQALRRLGARISVARFGTGHASIAQLKAIAPEVVKLDASFMRAACRSERDRERIRQLVRLARTVSPIVIVDGIESAWHLRVASESGAEWVAGSYLGRPTPHISPIALCVDAKWRSPTEMDPIVRAADGLSSYAAHIRSVGGPDGGLHSGHIGDADLRARAAAAWRRPAGSAESAGRAADQLHPKRDGGSIAHAGPASRL